MLVAVISLSVILADIFSKYLVVQLLRPIGMSVSVIPHVLDFTYVENRGIAFGLLADSRWIFMLVSATLLAVIICVIKFSKIDHKLFLSSMSLIFGGGIANMLDRIFIGYVVDFIEITFVDFAVFNVADSCVVVGACLLAVYLVFFDETFSKKRADGESK